MYSYLVLSMILTNEAFVVNPGETYKYSKAKKGKGTRTNVVTSILTFDLRHSAHSHTYHSQSEHRYTQITLMTEQMNEKRITHRFNLTNRPHARLRAKTPLTLESETLTL